MIFIYGQIRIVDAQGETLRTHLGDIGSYSEILDLWAIWWAQRTVCATGGISARECRARQIQRIVVFRHGLRVLAARVPSWQALRTVAASFGLLSFNGYAKDHQCAGRLA